MKRITVPLMPFEDVARSIYVIRGQKVMLDSDLARIYGVSTERLNQQVKRNQDRFPVDFMFRLTTIETENLTLQIARSSVSHGGRRYRPYAFTEHGALMLASVLRTSIAVRASVRIVRAFVKLREILAAHVELAHRLDELEKRLAAQDGRVQTLFDALRQLTKDPEPKQRTIGFHIRERSVRYIARRSCQA
jgi:ORF6N domain